MLDIKFIRENLKAVKEGAKNKNVKVDLDRLLELDEQKRKLQHEIDEMRSTLKKSSKTKPSPEDIKTLKKLGEQIKALEDKYGKIEVECMELAYEVPNVPLSDVPVGKDETENKVIREWGEIPKFDFVPKDHMEIGQHLDIIDTESAAKISGARFAYLKGGAALLEFALIQFTMEFLTSEKELKKIADKFSYSDKPFVPVVPPVMIRPEIFVRMGRLSEADKEERYYLQQDDQYLIGSAEHTLGPLHMDQSFNEADLPIRYIGFSTSFRREAGTYGKDTKGIIRVHQFDKLEMETFTVPEDSVKEQDFIVAIQEHLMQALEIPYRVVMICTGDMGKPDARQIDIESWIPSQNKYRETHTSDMMTDYQARRLNTKIRRKNGKTEYAHMNDATAFAIGRTIIAILENNQQKDGSVKIPKVLQKFVGKKVIKK